MKELTIEQKAERYDEIIERINELLYVSDKESLQYKTIKHILSEVEESEDERIRKELIQNLKERFGTNGTMGGILDMPKVLAWLEKQGEQKSNLPKWKYKNDNTPLLRDSIILNKYGCVAKSPAGALVDDVWVINYDELAKLPKEEFEKQGEQPNQDNSDVKDYNNIDPHFGKPIDKVEPKFHEGDWVFIEEAKGYKNGLFQIKTVDSFGYSFDEYHTIPFMYEELLSKWTIKDAKDGDVLSYRDGQWIFIYKEKIDDNSFRYHALYSTIHQDLTINDSGFTLLGDAIIPATKEQRDTLEKAIAEVGYAFDFDKKELKKIEQKPTDEVKPKFKPGDIVKNKKSGVTQILGGCIEDVYEGAFPFRIKDQDEWELVEHNPAEECSLKTNSKLFHQLIPAPKGLGINEIEQEHIKVTSKIMTQEDKQLLLADLCARLPYGVIVRHADCIIDDNYNETGEFHYTKGYLYDICRMDDMTTTIIESEGEREGYEHICLLERTVPYLRPMSSMTKKEKKEVSILLNYEFYIDEDCGLAAEDSRHRISLDLMQIYVDWLNKKMFAYRTIDGKDMFELGLAFEAPEGMYN